MSQPLINAEMSRPLINAEDLQDSIENDISSLGNTDFGLMLHSGKWDPVAERSLNPQLDGSGVAMRGGARRGGVLPRPPRPPAARPGGKDPRPTTSDVALPSQ